MVNWGRLGAGIATGGLSELGGARALGSAAGISGQDAKDFLLGGAATRGIDTQPKQYDAAQAMLGQMAGGAQARQAPMATAAQLGPAVQLAGGPQDQARAGMLGVAGNLGAMAGGRMAGAGELAVNRQAGQASAAQIAAARMARGANAALAYRQAARNMSDIGLGAAGMAAQAQMQDQQAANAQLGQLYGAMRGQDIDYAGQNAQLGQQAMLQQGAFNQQTGLANQQSQLTQRQMNDAMQIQALAQQLGWDQARIQAELAKAGIAMQDKGMLPGLLMAGGQVGAAAAGAPV